MDYFKENQMLQMLNMFSSVLVLIDLIESQYSWIQLSTGMDEQFSTGMHGFG